MPLKNEFKDEAYADKDIKVEKEDKNENEEIQIDTLNALPVRTLDEQDLMSSRLRNQKDFHNHDGINSEQVLFKNLHGFIKTVDGDEAALAKQITDSKPRRIEEQIRLYIDDLASPSTKRLYIYSFEARVWSYIDLT